MVSTIMLLEWAVLALALRGVSPSGHACICFCAINSLFRMKFPTGFTYRNLHGFARFPCDSMALACLCFIQAALVVHEGYRRA